METFKMNFILNSANKCKRIENYPEGAKATIMNHSENIETGQIDKENTISAQHIINMIYRWQFEIISVESPGLKHGKCSRNDK